MNATSSSLQPATATTTRERRRTTVAASIGNFVEWYDFGLYGFLAPVIAVQFFPSANSFAALTATFAVFGVAFLARPLGGLLFGHLGDRVGRRPVLAGVIILMSASTFMIGVLPTATAVGAIAPILLVLARFTQGISAGGELGGAITFVTEYAPATKRGRYGSWVFFTQVLGSLAAAIVIASLTYGLGPTSMQDWGWRIPFLIALPIGLVGLYLRIATKETPIFAAVQETHSIAPAPLRATFRGQRRELLQVAALVTTTTMTMLVITAYAPALLNAIGLSTAQALLASIAGLVTVLILCPILGALSDAIGRKPVMLATPIAAILLSVPAFLLLGTGDPNAAIGGCVLLGLVLAPFAGAGAATLAELFPSRLRFSGLAVGSALAIGLVGGFGALVLTWLFAATGTVVAPGAALVALGVISLAAAISLKESARTSWEDHPAHPE